MIIKIETKKSIPKGVKALAILTVSHCVSYPPTIKSLFGKVKKSGVFKGNKGEQFVLPQLGKKPEWIIFVGLGNTKHLTPEIIVKGVGTAVRTAKARNISTLALFIPEELKEKLDEYHIGRLVSEGLILGDYAYTKYLSRKKSSSIISSTILVTQNWNTKDFKTGIHEGKIIANAVNVTRDYGNAPSNEVTPQVLADLARTIGRKNTQKIIVLNQRQMQKEKMGGILGVTSGSVHEAQFIIMEHMNGKKGESPIVIIGKGITFDSGGISIKPSSKMDEMKYDMSGGGAVIGTMQAVGELKLPLNIVALVPATENVPSGTSYKPGDILTYADGTTVEVLNTDAEGRLILGDALIYARKYKPKAIIDLATLTGAIVVALGDFATAVFSNNDRLRGEFMNAARQSGEKMWHMPIPDEYSERMKSKFADLRNISSVSGGGALTAAAFLKYFVQKGTPWAHLDIAGTAWLMNETPDSAIGATGVGVRTLVEYCRRTLV